MAVAAIVLLCAAVLAFYVWRGMSNWRECRAHGFSRWYCWDAGQR